MLRACAHDNYSVMEKGLGIEGCLYTTVVLPAEVKTASRFASELTLEPQRHCRVNKLAVRSCCQNDKECR